ncbi:hypothetical protein F4802DRAFT_288036 [Xylaria palmicola]|nr:hypothetical protein F4802DRAFT_288036 [Xylaria palmicola]
MAQSSRSLEETLKATRGFSDLTIVCQGVEFATHRFIVCSHSPVLTAALTGRFSEAKTKRVNMDFDLDTVKRFLEFLYTGNYQETPDPALELITSVPTHGEEIQGTAVQRNIGQAIVLYDREDEEDDQNTAAEGSAHANLQLSNFTVNTSHKAPESWICHCRMTTIADYYNVARLSTISLAKLEGCFRSEWCVEYFCALLRDYLDEISNRDVLCLLGELAVEHYDEMPSFEFIEAGGFGERLAPFAVTNFIRLLRQTTSLCQITTTRFDSALSDAKQKSKNLKECKSLVAKWAHCRNTSCGSEFSCHFETKGPDHSPTYILRCNRCGCRHE